MSDAVSLLNECGASKFSETVEKCASRTYRKLPSYSSLGREDVLSELCTHIYFAVVLRFDEKRASLSTFVNMVLKSSMRLIIVREWAKSRCPHEAFLIKNTDILALCVYHLDSVYQSNCSREAAYKKISSLTDRSKTTFLTLAHIPRCAVVGRLLAKGNGVLPIKTSKRIKKQTGVCSSETKEMYRELQEVENELW